MQPATIEQVYAFLQTHLASSPQELALIGAGAWSRCFGFRVDDAEYVIRFGAHVEDFRKDQRAAAYASADLPIPRVLEIGETLGGYFAIAERAYGVPLESVDARAWRAVVPSLVAVLEALRTADIAATPGFGGWDEQGRASSPSWSHHLLAVANDTPDLRIHGWRRKLEAGSSAGSDAFAWGYAQLQRVVSDAIPRSLLHCDLMNRNVLVDDGGISAVFDWGCARYGDHLYDLAWFEFWAPWHPNLDVALLRTALHQRWYAVGYTPIAMPERLAACYLHIGLDHLAYNAHLGDWETLAATAARMKTLVEAVL
jgi:hygromycin-B 4-O-kinase